MELVVALGQPVANATADQVAGAIWGYACGLDMTRRDLQAEARKGGMPWDLAKDFEQSAVIGELVPVGATGLIDAGRIALTVNGQVRQQSDLSAMIWSVPDIIANLSHYYHLQPGDLIYTGTPEGVGAVAVGDQLVGEIEGVGQITLAIAPVA
jgi:fumarylpyruvate hydrolase